MIEKKDFKLIATAAFGLEKIVKTELTRLGFKDFNVSDGKIEFSGDMEAIAKTNLWLRCADRVLLKIAEFEASSFEELFENVKEIEWENWIPLKGNFTVNGKSVKSKLFSISACQSIVKKAIVEKLKVKYNVNWLEESGENYPILFSILKDRVIISMDTSGVGLHKRGYRQVQNQAPLKETLAAGLVLLSDWNKEKRLIDPLCGSGTILIEAAMIGKNIAPGLLRNFVSEKWYFMSKNIWDKEREKAKDSINKKQKLEIFGYDIEKKSIVMSNVNSNIAGVGRDIKFEKKELNELWIDREFGVVVTNPPYGKRLSDFKEINELYIDFNKIFKKKKGWSIYVLTADKMFEKYFKRLNPKGYQSPDRKRKLYNGKIEVCFYQYNGAQNKS